MKGYYKQELIKIIINKITNIKKFITLFRNIWEGASNYTASGLLALHLADSDSIHDVTYGP